MYNDLKIEDNYKNDITIVRVFAHIISYLFHPIFVPLYAIYFLIFIHPSYFSGFSILEKYKIIAVTILNCIFFPLFSILLMKGLGFIKSILLNNQQDRIGPYLSAMIFYFWTAWVYFKFTPQLDSMLPVFMTGVFLTTVVGLISNIYFKISMHAMGMGGLVGLFILILKSNTMLMTWPLSIAFLTTGLVCTARLIVSNHTTKEIYWGLFFGLACQFIAAFFII